MDTSLNPCICKELYGYLMELCLGLGFSYLLVRNSLTPTMKLIGLVQFWGFL